jgi:hypothetical protein
MKTTTQNTTAPALSLPPAAAIAAALPGRWVAKAISEESTWSNFYLTREDGLALFIAGSQGGWAAKGRFFLQHARPRQNGKYIYLWENHLQIFSPEITVADSKTAEKIAADIVARLLPEAERIDALARESIARDNRGEAARIDTARAIAGAIGEELNGHEGQVRSVFYHRGVSVTVNGGESVRVEFSATKAQTLAFIAFINSPAYQSGALV